MSDRPTPETDKMAKGLNLDYTPQTAEQIKKEIERFVGYKRLIDITNK